MSDLVALPEQAFTPGTEGLFDLPASTYHNHVKAPGISRSVIVELLQFTAAHAQSLITGTHKKTVTPEMDSGTLVDMALLEPDRFKEGVSHWLVPAGMSLASKDGIAWKKEHPKDGPFGLPYLREQSDAANTASLEDIKNIIASAMAHKKVRWIIENARKQESAFCYDPDTGLMRKVRPDARLIDRNSRLVLADLKTTFRGGTTEFAWRQQCARKGLHIQDSHYSRTYKDLTGEDPFFIFIVAERKPPYAIRLFQIDPEGKAAAAEKCRFAMEAFRKCQESGVWPAFDERITTVSLPRWELTPPTSEVDI